MYMDIDLERLIEMLRKDRRELHQIPEAGWKEYQTKAYLLERLKSYPCEIEEVGETGLCAYFSKSGTVPTVAFRSDMDGLPMVETSDVPYRSKHEGYMHSCGHDGHMAMLLGLADQLAQMITSADQQLPCNVLLLFQPAEEGPGGAKIVVDAGILEKYQVARIFGLHLGPSVEPGSLATRPGPLMARSSELDLIIHGRSAHCSTPEKGIDALEIGCQLVEELYQMEKEVLPAEEFRLLKFGKMESGMVRNAISDWTRIQGTVRCYADFVFDLLIEKMRKITHTYEEKTGCSIEIHYSDGYPAIENNPDLFQEAEDALSKAGFRFITLRKPVMSSDDFSYFAKKVPALYLFLGTGRKTPLHSDIFDFDEAILATGVRAYLTLLEL